MKSVTNTDERADDDQDLAHPPYLHPNYASTILRSPRDPDVSRELRSAELDELADPESYLGSSQAFIDRALAQRARPSQEHA